MIEFLWKCLAWLISRPAIAAWVIRRAKRTPYYHLDGYMHRWWLFNSYEEPRGWLRSRLPSIRVHHILRRDNDRHLHDHPWDARTIVLRGWYGEILDDRATYGQLRAQGDTRAIRFGEFHRINAVSPGGVYTLFFTWRYCGVWGFLVDGEKVPWRKYLGLQ